MNKKVHFEIGHVKNYDIERNESETESVFASNSLAECLMEYKNKKYSEPEYFIDVWETNNEGIPFPIAYVKLEDWIFQ